MTKKIKLVLSGSGTLFPAHAGGIIALTQYGYSIEAICGVSGGSIIAAALASGFKPNDELTRIIKQTLPGPNNLIDMSLWALATKWGLIKGEKIEKMLERHFIKTLGEAKIPATIVATNVNTGTAQFFSSSNEKDKTLPLAKVVHASMAIPFVFCPVKIGEDTFIDGGWLSNFPLDVFGPDSTNVVGLCFEAKNEGRKKISSIKDFITSLIGCSIAENVREDVEDAKNGTVIKLVSKHGGLNFGMVASDVDEMVQEGFLSVEKAIKAGRLAHLV